MTDQETVVLAFGEEHVERLTKLTRNQLRYWDRTGFFSPTYAEEGEQHTPYSRVYSFRDVVGLRTLGILRKQHNVSLQHLRQVAELLSHLKDELLDIDDPLRPEQEGCFPRGRKRTAARSREQPICSWHSAS